MIADIYILRLWLEPSQEGFIWRASVTDARSQERLYFSTPEMLQLFLKDLLSTIKNTQSHD